MRGMAGQQHERRFGWLRRYTMRKLMVTFRSNPAIRYQSRYIRKHERRSRRRIRALIKRLRLR